MGPSRRTSPAKRAARSVDRSWLLLLVAAAAAAEEEEEEEDPLFINKERSERESFARREEF